MPDPIQIDPVKFWKLRALMNDARLAYEQSQKLVAEAMTEAGLTPGTPYQLLDASCTAIAQNGLG